MRKRITLLIAALTMALTMSVGGLAFADNPHAGNSGHFKGSAGPCDNPNNHPNCPGPK